MGDLIIVIYFFELGGIGRIELGCYGSECINCFIGICGLVKNGVFVWVWWCVLVVCSLCIRLMMWFSLGVLNVRIYL